MSAPSYAERLAVEGGVLAGCGLAGSAVLVALVEGATDGPWNTAGQLAAVAGLCGWFGPRAVRRWTESAEAVAGDAVTGEPTPLWQLPAITAGLTLAVALPTGMWDAGLRVTAGCGLVGLT